MSSASKLLPLLLLVSIVVLVPSILTTTICKDCLPAAQIFDPGIGIELTLEYGLPENFLMSPFDQYRTISLRRHDGSIYDLGMIAGSSQYRHIMLQLYKNPPKAQDCSTELNGGSTPANEIASTANDLLNLGVRYRRYLRYQVYFIPFAQELIHLIFTPLDLALFMSRLRIRPPPRSLPEQEAIDILGAMIRALASHASSILSTPLNSTGIAVPDYFTAHDTSLTISALTSAGLGFIPTDWRFDQTASVAGTVSQGIGVCTDYRNRMACDSEWLPRETVLLLSFTNAALGLTLLLSGQGYLRKPFIADELHPELGLRALQNAKPVFDRIEMANEAEQVAALRAEIKRLLIREKKYPSKIVLMGDQTHQIVFQDALRDSLTELQPIHGYSSVHVERTFGVDSIVDPVFAGARGAAEMAKRAMESPSGGCVEAVHCHRERGE